MKQDRLIAAFALVLPLLILFGGVLFADRTFVFRDAAHFYYPLFQYVQQQWTLGLPLWNDLEQCGRPLLADPTSCVLYPGKLIFALPLEFSRAFVLFVCAHVLLAAFNTYWSARSLGHSILASSFAGVVYAYGGSIGFQYCNPIYLISAAWLPLGITAAYRFSNRPSVRGACGLAIVEAMMILGGDPQAAYNLVLIQIVLVVIISTTNRRAKPNVREAFVELGWHFTRSSLFALGVLAFAVGLTAIQFFPSVEWAWRSNRSDSHDVHASDGTDRSNGKKSGNVYSYAKKKFRGEDPSVDAMFQIPEPGEFRGKSYDFSIGPWRWAELLWPNISGDIFPVNTRWIKLLPAEGRTWTPSLYMGALPIFLILFPCRNRRNITSDRRPREQPRPSVVTSLEPSHADTAWQTWLKYVTILAMCGSLGWFGIGWLANEFCNAFGWPATFWSPVGGLYWLMNLLLPFYSQFRYPAKIWTFAALGISFLAARRLDELSDSSLIVTKDRIVKYMLRFSIVCLVTGIVVFVVSPWLGPALKGNYVDALFGPLHGRRVTSGIPQSMMHATLVAAIASGIIRRTSGKQLALGLLLLTVVELSVANCRFVRTAETAQWKRSSQFGKKIQEHAKENQITDFRIARFGKRHAYPNVWRNQTSDDRESENVHWDRETLFPRYALLENLPMFQSSVSFSAADFAAVAKLAADDATNREIYDWFSVAYLVGETKPLTDWMKNQDGLQLIATQELFGESISLVYNHEFLPRARILNHSIELPNVDVTRIVREHIPDANQRRQQLRNTAFFTDKNTFNSNFRNASLDGPPDKGFAVIPEGLPKIGESARCKTISSTPTHVVFRANLPSPGVMVLNDYHYPGWICTVRDMTSGVEHIEPIRRVNQIMRGVQLPRGDFKIQFSYRSKTVFAGAIVSAVFGCAAMIMLLRPRR